MQLHNHFKHVFWGIQQLRGLNFAIFWPTLPVWTVFIPWEWTKTDIFWPIPPHLVHALIECPLTDQFFTRTAGPVSLHELWKTPKIWISYLSLNQCKKPLTIMEIIKVSFYLQLTDWFLFSLKKIKINIFLNFPACF